MAAKGIATAILLIILAGFFVYVGNNPVVEWVGKGVKKADELLNYAQQASLTLYIKDPPPFPYSQDVQSIKLTFSKIELHQISQEGQETWITLTSGQLITIDLIKILNTAKHLGTFKIPAGTYTEIRFYITESKAIISGSTQLLRIPSGDQTGLKVIFHQGFFVAEGQGVTITVDIWADNSGIHNGLLIPSLTATVSR